MRFYNFFYPKIKVPSDLTLQSHCSTGLRVRDESMVIHLVRKRL